MSERIPTPESLDHLYAEIATLTTFDHDGGAGGYEASADAMWKAAAMTFNYVASKVGATGFQASWAALRFYGEVMGIDSPFTVVRIEDALYPQYDVIGRVQGYLDDQRDWLREQAVKKIAEHAEDDSLVHPNVMAHWRKLAAS